jgi:hypothetical protein
MSDVVEPLGVRTFKLFGLRVKAEVNLNTIVSIATLLGIVASAIWAVHVAVERPAQIDRKVNELRSEFGRPGQAHYVPGEVKGLIRRIDNLEHTVQANHSDSLQALQEIDSSIKEQGRENSSRFDRLDRRIDNLVESGAVRHPPRR